MRDDENDAWLMTGYEKKEAEDELPSVESGEGGVSTETTPTGPTTRRPSSGAEGNETIAQSRPIEKSSDQHIPPEPSPGAQQQNGSNSDKEGKMDKFRNLVWKFLSRKNVKTKTYKNELWGVDYTETHRVFEGVLYPSEYQIVRDAIGLNNRVTILNDETRNVTFLMTGKYVGQSRNVMVIDIERRKAPYVRIVV